MMMKSKLLGMAVALTACVISPAHSASYVFTTLDDPLATNRTGTFAQAIDNNGQVVGYYYDSSGDAHGFLYSGGSYITVDYRPGTANQTFPESINAKRQIVGWYNDRSSDHGFLYSGGIFTALNDPLATVNTFARAINARGQIVGYYQNGVIGGGLVNHGFFYSGGTYTFTAAASTPPLTIHSASNPASLAAPLTAPLPWASTTGGRSWDFTTTAAFTRTVSNTAAAATSPLTIPQASTAPLPLASTTRVKSSGITSTVLTTNAVSYTAAASTPPSTIPQASTALLPSASMTRVKSSGFTSTARQPTTASLHRDSRRERRRVRRHRMSHRERLPIPVRRPIDH
jgi:probable HAF family extracellular repeat protein